MPEMLGSFTPGIRVVFGHPKWCRISDINSMAKPGNFAGDLFGMVKTSEINGES